VVIIDGENWLCQYACRETKKWLMEYMYQSGKHSFQAGRLWITGWLNKSLESDFNYREGADTMQPAEGKLICDRIREDHTPISVDRAECFWPMLLEILWSISYFLIMQGYGKISIWIDCLLLFEAGKDFSKKLYAPILSILHRDTKSTI